jgi:hypothetical protein
MRCTFEDVAFMRLSEVKPLKTLMNKALLPPNRVLHIDA